MSKLYVDVVIIGAGSSGLNARRSAVKNGASVLLIEGGIGGTTCARVGCMPSKALISSAHVAHLAKSAAEFRIDVGDVNADTTAVMERMRQLRDRFTNGVRKMMANSIPESQMLKGWAKFTGTHTLLVDDKIEVEFKSVVVATGSSPWIPSPFDKVSDHCLTTDTFFELPALPKSMCVIGAGVIGLELGQAASRLGTRVAFFDIITQVGPFRDTVMADAVKNELEKELDFRLGVRFISAEKVKNGMKIKWSDSEGIEHLEEFELVLCATGRRPNLGEALNLTATGVKLSHRGMPNFDERTCQVDDSHVFVAGDVTGTRPVLHEASDEGIIAGRNSAWYCIDPQNVHAEPRRTPLQIVFTDPQIAVCGVIPEMDSGKYEYGEFNWSGQSRALINNTDRGLIRVYADLCGHLMGASMIGPDAEHHAHLLSWAIQCKLTVEQVLEMPFYHPVTEEGLRSAIRDLAARLKLRPKPSDMECGPAT